MSGERLSSLDAADIHCLNATMREGLSDLTLVYRILIEYLELAWTHNRYCSNFLANSFTSSMNS